MQAGPPVRGQDDQAAVEALGDPQDLLEGHALAQERLDLQPRALELLGEETQLVLDPLPTLALEAIPDPAGDPGLDVRFGGGSGRGG